MAGKGWVAPRRPSRRPPRMSTCNASSHGSTVSFDYICATVRRPRVYIKLLLAQSIIKYSGTTPGCLPPARGAAR